MKKSIITSIAVSFTLLTATAQAEGVRLVNEDGSNLSQLCISAARGEGSLYELAESLGINTLELSNVACNGEPIWSFIRSQRKVVHEMNVNNYSFNHGDSSLETELCIAAVTEPEKFEALKPEYLSRTGADENSIRCNSQPLNLFVKRYGTTEVTASL